jgi:GNAT superfamily N-acetyltransferase
MRIRPAEVHEMNLIAEVHEQTACVAYAHIFPDQPFPREETLARWQGFSGQIIVAEEDNAVIGFVALDESELHALYVLPNCQGRGVGSQLLQAACTISILWVLQENHSARKFYEAHGWMAEGKKRSAFGAVEVLYCRIQ